MTGWIVTLIAVLVTGALAVLAIRRRWRTPDRIPGKPNGLPLASARFPLPARDPDDTFEPDVGPDERAFRIRVEGETFRNDDGADRQSIIREAAQSGMAIRLVPEPTNPHDHLAVRVCLPDGRQIGYLPRNHGLTTSIKRGEVRALLDRVVGGNDEKARLDVVLWIIKRR